MAEPSPRGATTLLAATGATARARGEAAVPRRAHDGPAGGELRGGRPDGDSSSAPRRAPRLRGAASSAGCGATGEPDRRGGGGGAALGCSKRAHRCASGGLPGGGAAAAAAADGGCVPAGRDEGGRRSLLLPPGS